jgi:hypothetical protein
MSLGSWAARSVKLALTEMLPRPSAKFLPAKMLPLNSLRCVPSAQPYWASIVRPSKSLCSTLLTTPATASAP